MLKIPHSPTSTSPTAGTAGMTSEVAAEGWRGNWWSILDYKLDPITCGCWKCDKRVTTGGFLKLCNGKIPRPRKRSFLSYENRYFALVNFNHLWLSLSAPGANRKDPSNYPTWTHLSNSRRCCNSTFDLVIMPKTSKTYLRCMVSLMVGIILVCSPRRDL